MIFSLFARWRLLQLTCDPLCCFGSNSLKFENLQNVVLGLKCLFTILLPKP